MTEKPVDIKGPESLAGRLKETAGAKGGLVVTHPHPLYGGSMDNNVVLALVKAGAEAGWTTLRFNFRGGPGSSGSHGGGQAETADLLAAVDHLTGLGLDRVVVAGYSFGAWVAAHTDYGPRPVIAQAWVAPPVAMMPFETAKISPRPGLIIAGGRDEFCPPFALEKLTAEVDNPDLRTLTLERADHFFGGLEAEIRRATVDWLDLLPRGAARTP